MRTAAALMYARGVRATSVDDVLVAAEAGKSQLYHYFESKEDLAAAVLDHQLALVLGAQEQFRLETWTGIRAMFDALLEGQRTRGYRGCPVGSLAAEMSAISDEMAARVAAAFARWRTSVESAFEEMQARGRLTGDVHAEILADVTLAQIQGGYLLSTAMQEIAPMERALNVAYEHLRSYAV